MGIKVSNTTLSTRQQESIYLEDGTVRRVEVEENVYITEEAPFDERCVDVLFDITKAKDEEQLVSGWANVSVNADGSIPLDWQGDVIRPEVLEKAAINFMLEYRDSGVMHKGDSTGTVVESIVFTKDKQACLGVPEGVLPEGWFITVKVHDAEVFAKVKNGTFRMFSIQGNAKRFEI